MLLGRLDPEQHAGIELEAVDLCEVARDLRTAMADMALARNVNIELDAPDAPVTEKVQTELLAEAIANLVDNALKASSTCGVVRLEVTRNPPALSVSDDGPGIRDSQREAVFEHFVRGESASWPGSGLGLSIVRDIAQQHRAHISISDPVDARVTRITLEFEFEFEFESVRSA